MVDLGGTTNWNKNLEALSWKSFHELHYNTFYLQPMQFPYSNPNDAKI
jgi:hypothetical protein